MQYTAIQVRIGFLFLSWYDMLQKILTMRKEQVHGSKDWALS